MKQEEDGDEKRRLYYRRRFHPGWPLSRAAYKAAACYAKLVSGFFLVHSGTRALTLELLSIG
jgi:hypothetical protein